MSIKIRILDYEGDGIKHVNGIQTLSFLIAGSPDTNNTQYYYYTSIVGAVVVVR
jgi:hypothetical protein